MSGIRVIFSSRHELKTVSRDFYTLFGKKKKIPCSRPVNNFKLFETVPVVDYADTCQLKRRLSGHDIGVVVDYADRV